MYSKRNSRFDETQKETWSDYGNGVVSFGMLVIVLCVRLGKDGKQMYCISSSLLAMFA